MELVVDPHSFIGLVVGLIVKNPEALHFIVFPLSVVTTTVLVVKFASTMSLAVHFVPLVPAAHLEMLLDKLRLRLDSTRL